MYIVIWQIGLQLIFSIRVDFFLLFFRHPHSQAPSQSYTPNPHTQLSTLGPLTIALKPSIFFFFSELIFEWGLGMKSIWCRVWESCTKEDNLRKKRLGKRKLGVKPQKRTEAKVEKIGLFFSNSPQVLRQKNPPFRKPLVSLLPLWMMIKFPFLIFITLFSGPKTNQRFLIKVPHQKDLDPNVNFITTSHWPRVSQPLSLPEISFSTHWL